MIDKLDWEVQRHNSACNQCSAATVCFMTHSCPVTCLLTYTNSKISPNKFCLDLRYGTNRLLPMLARTTTYIARGLPWSNPAYWHQ